MGASSQQEDKHNGLLRREQPVPLMSQVLHFLDFIPNRPRVLHKWRKKGIKQFYSVWREVEKMLLVQLKNFGKG